MLVREHEYVTLFHKYIRIIFFGTAIRDDAWNNAIHCNILFNNDSSSGSVLVAAAQFGAHVWGWDIDFLTLHARTKPTRHSQVKS